MIDDNPYSAPAVIPSANEQLLPQGDNGGIWSDGDLLVVHKHARLPRICVKTRQAAGDVIHRKFYWHSRLYYLLIFIHILVYALVAFLLRKKHELDIPLSMESAARRRSKILKCWSFGILGFVLLLVGIFGAASSRQGDPMLWVFLALLLAGVVMSLASALIGSYAAMILVPKKMTDHATWFKGADPAFVRSFPPIPPQTS